MRVTGKQESAAGPERRGAASRAGLRAPLARLRVQLGGAMRSARGVTGLETAIILIAFVAVGSVFA